MLAGKGVRVFGDDCEWAEGKGSLKDDNEDQPDTAGYHRPGGGVGILS